LIEHLTETAANDDRIYTFEWERIPHISENAKAKREALPIELLQKIAGFVLDSDISKELFIRGSCSQTSAVRGLTKVPDMLRTAVDICVQPNISSSVKNVSRCADTRGNVITFGCPGH
jgi:hypothetical protein